MTVFNINNDTFLDATVVEVINGYTVKFNINLSGESVNKTCTLFKIATAVHIKEEQDLNTRLMKILLPIGLKVKLFLNKERRVNRDKGDFLVTVFKNVRKESVNDYFIKHSKNPNTFYFSLYSNKIFNYINNFKM